MVSSVSSEQAFSQGGITISKHRNRLKGDIVEALQCLKCAIRRDLLFKEPGPSSVVEVSAVDSDENDSGSVSNSNGDANSWDLMLEDDDDIYAAEGEE